MTKQEINELLTLIFSEDEEDFKLALNMIMKMECSVDELNVLIGHCNNLLVANLKHQNRVKVLIYSMGSVLLDKGYEVISAAGCVERWNSRYNTIMNQIFKDDLMTGIGSKQSPIYPTPLTGNSITVQSPLAITNPYNQGITSSPFNAGTTLTNNGTGNLIQDLKNTNSPFLPSYKQGITLADGTGNQGASPF